MVNVIGVSGLPESNDLHLRIWLGGIAFDYRVAATAAAELIHDWERKRWCSMELMASTVEDRMPEARLPNERLFFGP
ncbi:hypothetical protein [Nocardia africana]|uniref:Uncharacterized protein n=1 Tax=Nocardia africana TaxID=134964 RepID=A0ABW6NCL2_9NOCA